MRDTAFCVKSLDFGIGGVVELAFGRDEYALPPFRAEPAVMEVEGTSYKGLFLAAHRGVRALDARWAADRGNGGGLDRIQIFDDDGQVEILTSPRHCPGRV